MWLEKWINFLAVISISIGLLILCTFIMITLNMNSVIQHWAEGFGMVVYLEEKAANDDTSRLNNYLMSDNDLIDVKYVSKEQALNDVRRTLGTDAIILDGLKANPLPASFDLKIKSDLLQPGLVKQKARKLESIEGVAEVQYGEKWLSSLSAVSRSMKIGAVFLGCAIFIAVTFITYSTIKIFFYRRREEVETLKLLGAARGFIKAPFLIEGLVLGTLGGIISSMIIFSAYSFTSLKIMEFLPAIKFIVVDLPVQTYLMIPVAGALMSLSGSFIAVGRIRY
jgi:cell division transport system permease protein